MLTLYRDGKEHGKKVKKVKEDMRISTPVPISKYQEKDLEAKLSDMIT
jgi:hypothetical protein